MTVSNLPLHLNQLFELRVNQSVCHFVAIIVRIVGKIQVFFLIFAFGILAFAIAMLHLLRGCAVGKCDHGDVLFPYSFHRAISTTYFFTVSVCACPPRPVQKQR